MKKIILVLLLVPSIVFAQDKGFSVLIDKAFDIITKVLIPLAFAACIFYFFWGIAKYMRAGAGSEEAAKEGKNIMIWGVVGIFVAFSIWGIIALIQNELGIKPLKDGSVEIQKTK